MGLGGFFGSIGDAVKGALSNSDGAISSITNFASDATSLVSSASDTYGALKSFSGSSTPPPASATRTGSGALAHQLGVGGGRGLFGFTPTFSNNVRANATAGVGGSSVKGGNGFLVGGASVTVIGFALLAYLMFSKK